MESRLGKRRSPDEQDTMSEESTQRDRGGASEDAEDRECAVLLVP